MTGSARFSRVSLVTSVCAVAGVWLLGTLAYWPALSAGFVSDDFLVLRHLSEYGGLQHPAAYFTLRHFEYYRPVAFLSLALDWQAWARSPAGYHATALLLHGLNALLVYVLSRRLMGVVGATAAAALFTIHPSSHEAVVWVSSRFDLLATAWVLAGLFALRSKSLLGDTLAAAAFLAAVLSKESATALPVVAAAAIVLLHGAKGRRVLIQLALFAVAGLIYTLLRQGAGLPSMGGAARLPKLAVFGVMVASLLAVAQLGWLRMWSEINDRRRSLGVALVAAVALSGILAWTGPLSGTLRGVFGSVAFAATHLLSPVTVDWAVGTIPSAMWVAGWLALSVSAASIIAGWRSLERSPDIVYLAVFLVAALVPVSSMTEGTRYLYLASVPAAILAGRCVDALSGRRLAAAAALIVVLIGTGVLQVRAKAADWKWASEMTGSSAALIASSLGGQCADRDVVLITAPVRIRGVYSNLNLEGLAWLRDCIPATLRTVVRAGLDDPRIEVRWAGGTALEFSALNYAGGFVTSKDWRTFDVPLDRDRQTRIACPLGTFDAMPSGSDLAMRLSFDRGQPSPSLAWFYFSNGTLHALPSPDLR